jgi:protein gp37
MGKTKIDWADVVWNPTIGCTKVSAGCVNCYAERMAARLKAMGRPEYQDVVDDKGHWTGKIKFLPERLDQPIHWLKPKRIFVDSMSDLFHTCVPFEYIKMVLKVMVMANQHTFIILTKRPELMLEFTEWIVGEDDIKIAEWPRNVWFGVSVSTQKDADKMIPVLLQTPASIRIISVEPMLERISLGGFDGKTYRPWLDTHAYEPMLSWVICGGESGPNARSMHPDWVKSLRNQCKEASVPFFFKQWGKWAPVLEFVDRKRAGHLLDGKEYHEFPGEL